MRVDAHTHVWHAIPVAASGVPTIMPPQADIPIELLLTYLDDHSVDRAVLVQPVYPGEDNSYVAEAAAGNRPRLAAVCVVDPNQPNAPERLTYWISERGCRGLRMRPRIPEEGAVFGRPSTFDLWQTAAQLKIVINLLIGFEHLPVVARMADRFSGLPIVIDHLAHPGLSFDREAAAPLLNLAQFDNVYVKVSGFYYFSRQTFPFDDCADLARAVYDRFGPDRLIWGSDFPHVLLKSSYARALMVVDRLFSWLTAAERELILGGNAARLYWNEADP